MWAALKSLFTSEKEPEPHIPDSFDAHIPVHDSDETVDATPSAENDDISGLSFGIQYEDRNGEISERWVTAYGFTGYPPEFLSAHCHARDAVRTFRLDRIAAVFDQDGEIIVDAAGFFEQFSPVPGPSSDGKRLLKVAKNGIVALVALSKSDGVMRDEEIEQIVGYIEDMGEVYGMQATEEERAACNTHVRRMRPRSSTVENAVERLAYSEKKEINIFLNRAQKLIEADGKIDPAEFETLMSFQQILNGA